MAHKSYGSGNPIQISVYEDKIMIWNEGQLPEEWTIKKLLEKHASVPFNPAVASTFFWAGFIESWGRGTLKIVNECRRSGIPDPVFTYDPPGFWLEFHSNVADAEVTVGKTVGNTAAILSLIKVNPYITREELATATNLSVRGVEYHLKNLRESNVIERTGSKGGHWKVLAQQ